MNLYQNYRPPFFGLKNDNYCALIGSEPTGMITISVIDFEKEEMLPTHSCIVPDIIEFLNQFSFIFKEKFKAVIVSLEDYCPPHFANNLEFCQTIRAILEEMNIPYFFIVAENLLFTELIVSANICAKVDDVLIIVITDGQKDLSVTKLKYTAKGFDKSMTYLTPEMQATNNERLRQQIIGTENPKKVILCSSSYHLSPMFKMLRNTVLKSKKLIVFESGYDNIAGKSIIEILKWLKDESYTRFHIIPKCTKKFIITNKLDNFDNPLIVVNIGEQLPLIKKFFVKELTNVYFYITYDDINRHLIYSLKRSGNFKKIIFQVDNEGFPYHNVQEYPDFKTLTESLPLLLDEMPLKLPVIIFFQNYSLICIHENNNYKFLESWNEINKEIFIELYQNKLMINKMNNYDSGNSFAVKDLIQIMSMAPDKIVANEEWKFKVTTTDYENAVMLEFDTPNGERKATPPSFLMAYLVKQQIKAIEKETNERPRKIAFWIFDKFDEEEHKRIQTSLIESCNTLSSAKQKYKCECEFPLLATLF